MQQNSFAVVSWMRKKHIKRSKNVIQQTALRTCCTTLRPVLFLGCDGEFPIAIGSVCCLDVASLLLCQWPTDTYLTLCCLMLVHSYTRHVCDSRRKPGRRWKTFQKSVLWTEPVTKTGRLPTTVKTTRGALLHFFHWDHGGSCLPLPCGAKPQFTWLPKFILGEANCCCSDLQTLREAASFSFGIAVCIGGLTWSIMMSDDASAFMKQMVSPRKWESTND